MSKTRRLVLNASFLAIAIVLGYAESFIPMFIPGVRLGLANVITLILLYSFSLYEAALVSILRVFVVSLLRGNFLQMPFYMSLAGALVSLLIMWLAKMFLKKLTIYGVSILGSYFHCLSQCLVGVIFLGNWGVMYYFPFIALISLASGILTALIADRIVSMKVLDRLKKDNAE